MSSPVKDTLLILNRHADVIELGLAGGQSLANSPDVTPQAIAALRQAQALRPAGEDGYRLHPRLREYLQDLMQTFPAYQSLAEIGSKITLLYSLWSEIDALRRAGDRVTLDHLVDQMEATVFDIGYAVDRNMVMLQSRLSTRYGNVGSLSAKQSQNRWYQKQTTHLSGDMSRLGKAAEKLEQESAERRMDELASFLRRHLLARLLPWQENLTEMQSLIRKELFLTQQLQENQRRLGQVDVMLRQHPGWRGVQSELAGEIPDFLLAASMGAIKAHAEPLDGDAEMAKAMESLARDLPAPRQPAAPPPPPVKQTLIEDEPSASPITPAARALSRLFAHARTTPAHFSLLDWRMSDEEAMTMPPNSWMVFSMMALSSGGFKVELTMDEPRAGEIYAHTFRDAVVQGRKSSTREWDRAGA